MLSVTAQYALRALIRLASAPPGTFVLGRDLSRQEKVPANYLSKILLALAAAGLVEAVRGSGGGYRLSRPPDQIRLIEVVAMFDRQMSRSACLLGLRPVCSDDDPCVAHEAWRDVKDQLLSFLENTTLTRLLDRKQELN